MSKVDDERNFALGVRQVNRMPRGGIVNFNVGVVGDVAGNVRIQVETEPVRREANLK